MATEAIPKQEFLVRNLQTRSVTLYPLRAQIIRDITGIALKPGPNQITIVGLTPTVDEHSIKVDGTGAATITDLSVELVANKEIFEDIYPSDDEETEESEEEDDSENEDDATKLVTKQLKEINVKHAAAQEKFESASARLSMLDHYSSTLQKNRPEDLEKCLKDYHDERSKAYGDQVAAGAEIGELNVKIKSLDKLKARLGKAVLKAKLKAMAEANKKTAKKMRRLEEIRQEKLRIKAERAKFWPKKVYKVIISLEAPSGATPGSSRRGSVDSLVKVPIPDEKAPPSEISTMGDINLSLSYITYAASWSPRYDLSLNTVTSRGALDYCAELKNTTSETWRDTKVVLSTSQTTYQGLGDTIPIMQPWHVRLVKGGAYGGSNSLSKVAGSAALYSQHEQDQKSKNISTIPPQVFAPRDEWFGLSTTGNQNHFTAPRPNILESDRGGQIVPQQHLQQMQQMQTQFRQGPVTAERKGMFGGPPVLTSNQAPPIFGTTSLFGAAGPLDSGANTFGTLAKKSGGPSVSRSFGMFMPSGRAAPSAPAPGALGGGGYGSTNDESGRVYDSEEDGETMAAQDPALLFEESSFSDSGLTTTYDVPTLKTLSPTSTTTKHKIATIEFKSVIFSHVLVPKLKASAFLKAKLRNASKIALLKGPAGLTLDGSFLGQSTIPRCSAGDSFTLPLGVDPTINVSYAKPTVRRSQSGIFSKEECEVFTRIATVTNTKHNAIVELQVLDQVPISEDERLKIEIVSPRGLRVGGESVPAGQGLQNGSSDPASDSDSFSSRSSTTRSRMSVYGDTGAKATGTGKEVTRWGSAVATAKKDGEINWSVKINPLRGCKLMLEYEATFPGGEFVQGIN